MKLLLPFPKTIKLWSEEAKNDAVGCLAEAPSQSEECLQPKFDDWWERSKPTYDTLKALQDMDDAYSSLVEQIDETYDSITVIEPLEDDYESPDEDYYDWTVSKLLDDI